MSEMMMVGAIATRSPFKDLFNVEPHILKAIEDDMREYGFDESAPIVLWKEGNVVIDGHTRLQAAKNIGLKEVHVCVGDFDEETALEYAMNNQRNRRNLTDAEILRQVELLDKRIGRWPLKHSEGVIFRSKDCSEGIDNIEGDKNLSSVPSHEKTATMIGITASKVSKVRAILDSKNNKLKQEVLDEEKTIHAASQEIKKAKLKARPMTAQVNIAYRKFEKEIAKVIKNAILNGIEVSQIKQVVKELLKSKEVSPCA